MLAASESRVGRGARSPSPARRGDLRGQLQLSEQDVPAAHAPGGADDDRRGARARHHRRSSPARTPPITRPPISIAAPTSSSSAKARSRSSRCSTRSSATDGAGRADVDRRACACATPTARSSAPARATIIRNLDALPFPAWDLVDVERYRSIWRAHHGYFSMNLVTTRGCPYHCNWCAKPIYGQRYTARSPEHVVDEMAWLKRTFRPDHLWIADDIFGLKPGWIERFADAAAGARRRDAVQVPAARRSGDRRRRARAARAPAARRRGSAPSRARSAFSTRWRRAPASSRSRDATRLLHDAGIEVGFFLQFGYPGETREDIERTLRDGARLRARRHRRVGVVSAAGHDVLSAGAGAARRRSRTGSTRTTSR